MNKRSKSTANRKNKKRDSEGIIMLPLYSNKLKSSKQPSSYGGITTVAGLKEQHAQVRENVTAQI